ncbi:MAG TPA: hypothetical protein VGD72_07605 [Mycobacteriales bacterium]|jgi:hypothetical protein
MATMVLLRDWRDPDGTLHREGAPVDVSAELARSLAADGVAEWPRVRTAGWHGPTVGPRGADPDWD